MSADIFENINPRDKRTEGEEKLLNVLKNSTRFYLRHRRSGYEMYQNQESHRRQRTVK